jgi:hypothetical protein
LIQPGAEVFPFGKLTGSAVVPGHAADLNKVFEN